MNNDFSNVKVGDRLWSATFGWITITEVNTVAIVLRTTNNEYVFFNKKGSSYDYPDVPQSLFFEEMEMVPVKPVSKPEEIKPFDPNKPYCCRDGKSCQIVHTTKEGKFVVIVAETDLVYYCRQNGHYLISSEHNNDLINIPERIEGWVNLYPSNVKKSKEDADSVSNPSNRIACIQVSFQKGEGLKCQD